MEFLVVIGCSGSGYVHGDPAAVVAVPVHRFRHPLPDHAHHQRLPLLGHDLLLFQNGDHREGAQHHRRVRSLSLLARISVRLQVIPFIPLGFISPSFHLSISISTYLSHILSFNSNSIILFKFNYSIQIQLFNSNSIIQFKFNYSIQIKWNY